ncbi:MAG: hypothetical protein NC081_11020 [Roseburia sp.]|nr:hypothetical protein [Roseburia sp.]
MEYMIFFGAFILFLLFIFIKEYFASLKRKRKLRQSLYEDFGKFKERQYPAERYERIGSYYKKHQKPGQVDDITWNDLNMDEIFKRMNFTYSAAGEEYLYYTLRDTGKSREELEHFEELVRFFTEHTDERVKLQLLMKQLGHTGKFSLYDYLDHLDYLGERSNKKAVFSDLLFVFLLFLIPFQMTMAVLGISLLLIYNISTYYGEKKDIEPYIISFVYVVRLLEVCDELEKVSLPACRRETGLIREYKQKLAAMRRGAFWVFWGNHGASGNPLDMIFDYIRMAFHIDLIQFNRMLGQLRLHIEDVDALIGQVGLLETAISVGAFRLSLEEGYCVPVFTKKREIHMEEGYHPLLAHPVKNSIRTGRGVLLTGSNASGKSTFLKMVAINGILAQTIHTCAARRYEGGLFRIMSSMSLRDDLESGESYYIVEIKSLKRIIQAAREGEGCVLCFVDEVLRGTNTVERIAAATQILKSLAGEEFLCFGATHDMELTGLLEEFYDNYHFEEEIKAGDILFPYKLLPGRATTRNAIKLLEIMGYEKRIIEAAEAMAEEFIASGVWR